MTLETLWRPLLGLAGVLLLVGGPLHPQANLYLSFNASTANMLADAHWPLSHGLMLAGELALVFALLGIMRRAELSDTLRRVVTVAVVASMLGVVEMTFHFLAMFDRQALLDGAATPVLTTHLTLAVLTYPIFGLSMAALAFVGARGRMVGGASIAILGVVGGLMDAVSAPIVVLNRNQAFSWLFAGMAPLALWMCLAAIWPRARIRIS